MATPRLLDVVRDRLRAHHYSVRTEKAYLQWIRRYIRFHKGTHPRDLRGAGGRGVPDLPRGRAQVSASTQNQALAAVLFLYRDVYDVDIGWLDGVVRAKASEHVPVVLSRDEVARVLGFMTGTEWLVCSLLYGSGMRLTECLQLRVKDVGFDYKEIVVRNGKGQKDRVTILPEQLFRRCRCSSSASARCSTPTARRAAPVSLVPYGLQRKYPDAPIELGLAVRFPVTRARRDAALGRVGAPSLSISARCSGRCSAAVRAERPDAAGELPHAAA